MSTGTKNTTRMLKFKNKTVFQCYVKNLESYDHNTKQPLLIKVLSTIHCKRPSLNNDSSFYIIYSPCTFKLRPKKNFLLDLQSKIDKSKHIDETVELLPSYSRKISLENSEQIARIKENFIIFDILNRDFNNNFTIKTYQELGYIFLNQKSFEKIITEYHLI